MCDACNEIEKITKPIQAKVASRLVNVIGINCQNRKANKCYCKDLFDSMEKHLAVLTETVLEERNKEVEVAWESDYSNEK